MEATGKAAVGLRVCSLPGAVGLQYHSYSRYSLVDTVCIQGAFLAGDFVTLDISFRSKRGFLIVVFVV